MERLVLCTASVILSVCSTNRFGITGCYVCIVILFLCICLHFSLVDAGEINSTCLMCLCISLDFAIISVLISCLCSPWQQLPLILTCVNFSSDCRAPTISGASTNFNYNMGPNSVQQRKGYLCMFLVINPEETTNTRLYNRNHIFI